MKSILENAKNQLVAEKETAFKKAHDEKYAELVNELTDTQTQAQKTFSEGVALLQKKRDEVIEAKRIEIDTKATCYANATVATINANIINLEKMIEGA